MQSSQCRRRQLQLSPAADAGPSNLQNFLRSVMPVVPSKIVPRRCIPAAGINNWWVLEEDEKKESIEYFTLGDLWASFDEWSAYGVGTPVALNHYSTSVAVVQYYVPYLSAIQIYTTNPSSSSSSSHHDQHHEVGQDDQMECWSSSSTIDGSDHQNDEALAVTRSSSRISNNSSAYSTTNCNSAMISCCFDGRHIDPFGHLYFQYHDVSSPYWRIPLADKIMDFIPNYPSLMKLRSVDLSPASWMSIAWYPIYQIPTKWYVKDLATCFLTYHTLSSSFQDSSLDSDYYGSESSDRKALTEEPKRKLRSEVALPAFGLATYKMKGQVWMNPDKYDQGRLLDLYSAADSWLKQLNFHHHDFHFFKMHPHS